MHNTPSTNAKKTTTMSTNTKKTTPFFQFGESMDFDDNTSAIQANVSIDFRKMFNSWLMFLPYIKVIEGKKMKEGTEDLLMKHTYKEKISDRRKHNKNTRKNGKTLHVDLMKLENLSCLTKHEKKQLKRLIYELKCDERNRKEDVTRKPHKTKVNYVSVSKPSKTKSNIKCDNIPTFIKKPIIKSPVYKMKKNKNLECNDCRKCSENIIVNKMQLKHKPRIPATTITLSDQKLLDTIIDIDTKSHGDSPSSLSATHVISSIPTINGISADKKNININTLELKYINPTYVVQYSSDVLQSEDSCVRKIYESNFVSNFKHKPASTIQSDIFRNMSMHPAPVPVNHVVGMALTSGVNDLREPHLSEDLPERKHRDPVPSYVLPAEQRAGSGSLTDSPKTIRKGSACRTLTSCIKWCLCLSSGDCSQSTSRDIEEPMSKTDKAGFVEKPTATLEDVTAKKPSKQERKSAKSNKNNSRYVRFKSTVNIND